MNQFLEGSFLGREKEGMPVKLGGGLGARALAGARGVEVGGITGTMGVEVGGVGVGDEAGGGVGVGVSIFRRNGGKREVDVARSKESRASKLVKSRSVLLSP